MTTEQRAFVEKLLEDWCNSEEYMSAEGGIDEQDRCLPRIAARRAEFERLFPITSDSARTPTTPT